MNTSIRSTTTIYFATILNIFLSCVVLAKEDKTQSLFEQDIEVAPGIVAVLSIVAGLVYTFYGYRLFRYTLFCSGFSAGGLLGYATADRISNSNPYAMWISFIVAGLIVGSLALSLYDLGIFIIGAGGGILLAFFLHTSFSYKISPGHSNVVLLIAMLVFGIAGGLLTTYLQRPALIVITSAFGAMVTVWGVGYLAGDYPSAVDLDALKQLDGDIIIPSEWWYYFAATVILFLVGSLAQFTYTAKGYDRGQKKQSGSSYSVAQTPKPSVYVISHPVHLV